MLFSSRNIALPFLLAGSALALGAAGCSGNVSVSGGTGGTGGTGGATSTSSGGAGGNGGTGGGDTGGTGGGNTGTGGAAMECNTLVDKGPTISPACPGVGGGNGPCPDCSEGSSLGGVVADGTYLMTGLTVWASGCGIVHDVPTHATLQIQGGTMQIVSTGPQNFGTTMPVTQRLTASYTVNGTTLEIKTTCPDNQGPYPVDFTAQGKKLTLRGLPGVFGTPTFELQ